jgi:hypothetical protein
MSFFLTIFDTSNIERARAFQSFFHGQSIHSCTLKHQLAVNARDFCMDRKFGFLYLQIDILGEVTFLYLPGMFV